MRRRVTLRACECFEFLLLLGGVLFGGKRPRGVSPSRVCVEVDNIAIEFWPFSGRNRLKSPELALCVYTWAFVHSATDARCLYMALASPVAIRCRHRTTSGPSSYRGL